MAEPVRHLDPISEISVAIALLLAPYFPAAKWNGTPAIVGLPFSPEQFKRLADTTPRLHIGWEGVKPSGAGRSFKGTFTFRLIIVVKNTGRSGPMLGDKLGPGIYPSVMAAVAALHGRTLNGIGSIEVTDANQATVDGWREIGAAAGIVSFTINNGLGDLLGEGEAAPQFLRLVSDFDVVTDPDPDAVPALPMRGDANLPPVGDSE
ncbi:hypothetical protein [Ancylobacter defluvii]|uniref:Uncharacterized protein n=1 Tax=Ancylobacter defluvii TaxID=1282440 RepID=A0A9W6NBM7_9HYPH|nr:hypothetical protein [Ancylobacter defluvii]MBS7586408.1 hypothetical protein [Ancylobacter defluvii]GLK85689.1 hypothetical protein GCM10017653_37590 [Ancylobacter defluvii]